MDVVLGNAVSHARLLKASDDEAYTQIDSAAWIMEDALHGIYIAQYPRGAAAAELRDKENMMYYLRKVFSASLNILLVLMLIESPPWCKNWRKPSSFLPVQERCPLPDGSTVELFGIFILPPAFSLPVEVTCMFCITVALLYESTLNKQLSDLTGGGGRPFKPGIFLSVLWVMWIDIIIYSLIWPPFRVAHYGRIALLFYWPRTVQACKTVTDALQNIGNIMMFLSSTLMFFAWLLVLVMRDLRKVEWYYSFADCGFNNFGETMLMLFEMMSGASFPAGMTPAVKKIRGLALIFYPFMFLTFFLFMKLMLAVVYNSYQDRSKNNLERFLVDRCKGITHVFYLLAHRQQDAEPVIKVETFERLVNALQKFPVFRHNLRKEDAHIFFNALDQDGDGELTIQEFFHACETLQHSFRITRAHSFLLTRYGSRLQWARHLVESGLLDRRINQILLLNTLFMVYESVNDLSGFKEVFWVEPVETFFSVVYLGDVFVRLSVVSFSTYWMNPSNRFDFVVSVVLFFSGISTLIPQVRHYRWIVTYFNLLRALRIVRLIGHIERFQTMFACIANLWLVCGDMFLMMGITICCLGTLGMNCFGGLLYASNPALAGTDYLTGGDTLWNFNDLLGSCLTVLNMLICTFQPEYVEALNNVSKVPSAGLIYCLFVFCVGVSLAFNIVTAFTIDVFVALEESKHDKKRSVQEDNLESLRAQLRAEGKLLHVTMPGEVRRLKVFTGMISGMEERIQAVKDDVISAHRHTVLQSAFSFASEPSHRTLHHKGCLV